MARMSTGAERVGHKGPRAASSSRPVLRHRAHPEAWYSELRPFTARAARTEQRGVRRSARIGVHSRGVGVRIDMRLATAERLLRARLGLLFGRSRLRSEAVLEIEAIILDAIHGVEVDIMMLAIAAVASCQLDRVAIDLVNGAEMLAARVGDFHMLLDPQFLEHDAIPFLRVTRTAPTAGMTRPFRSSSHSECPA